MANEMFTTRSGKQVPVKVFTIPPVEMASIMRLQEDFAQRGEHLSLLGVVLHVIDKGISTTRNYWKNVQKQKGNRDLGKVITFMLSKGANMQAIAEFLEQKTGKKIALDAPSNGQPTETGDGDLDVEESELLTDEQLEAATSPNAAV